MPNKAVSKRCLFCSVEFSANDKRGRSRRYCSRRCGGRAAMQNYILSNPAHIPWNKGQAADVICPICNTAFRCSNYRLNKTKSGDVCCSRQCADEVKRRGGTPDQVMDLIRQGKTPQEIACILKRPVATVYSAANRRKFRFRQPGLSRSAIVNVFLKGAACVVCGWTRCLDAAHITPASKGGTMEESNLLPLCPNHHRLFDKRELMPDELYRIEEYCNARKSRLA